MLTSNQILPCSPPSSYSCDNNFLLSFYSYYLQLFISSFHFWSISPSPRIWAAPVPLLLSTASLYSPTFSSPHSINPPRLNPPLLTTTAFPILPYYFTSYSIYQFIPIISINQHPSVCLRLLRLISFSPAVRTWLAGNPSSHSVLALFIGRCVTIDGITARHSNHPVVKTGLQSNPRYFQSQFGEGSWLTPWLLLLLL